MACICASIQAGSRWCRGLSGKAPLSRRAMSRLSRQGARAASRLPRSRSTSPTLFSESDRSRNACGVSPTASRSRRKRFEALAMGGAGGFEIAEIALDLPDRPQRDRQVSQRLRGVADRLAQPAEADSRLSRRAARAASRLPRSRSTLPTWLSAIDRSRNPCGVSPTASRSRRAIRGSRHRRRGRLRDCRDRARYQPGRPVRARAPNRSRKPAGCPDRLAQHGGPDRGSRDRRCGRLRDCRDRALCRDIVQRDRQGAQGLRGVADHLVQPAAQIEALAIHGSGDLEIAEIALYVADIVERNRQVA